MTLQKVICINISLPPAFTGNIDYEKTRRQNYKIGLKLRYLFIPRNVTMAI